MKSHISIIGMPWSGKSTVAYALAKKLGWNFIDLDKEVERVEEKNLIDVMNEKGPEYFRKMEYGFLLNLSEPTVISLAGSIIYYEPALRWLRDNSRVIFLNTPIEIIKSRMEGNPKAVSDLSEGIDALFIKRLPLYQGSADYSIDAQERDVAQIVDEIIMLLGR
jgi:shikimate kinase